MITLRLLLALAWAGLIVGASASAATVTLALHDAAGAAVPSGVIWLEGPGGRRPPPTEPIIIDQRNKVFVPQVTVVQTGTDISFPNSDSVSHHVYSFAQPNAFELPLYKGGKRPIIRFDHPGVVVLGCNIHDSMIGYVVVVDTALFGITDAQGSLSLAEVPAGTYQLRVWSPRLDPARPLQAGSLSVTVQPVSQALSVSVRLRREPAGGSSLAGSDY
jgi:plastocyanin